MKYVDLVSLVPNGSPPVREGLGVGFYRESIDVLIYGKCLIKTRHWIPA